MTPLARRAVLLALVCVLPAIAPAPAHAQASTATGDVSVQRALAFLAAGQSPMGTFATYARNVVEAAASAGMDPLAWPTPERSAFGALDASAPDAERAYLAMLRVAHAIGTSGYDPRAWKGRDLVSETRARFDGAQFGNATWVNDDAWAILALRAAGVAPDDEQIQAAVRFLLVGRAQDGGWGYLAGATSDTDTTGMVLAALRAGGHDMVTEVRGKAYLDATRRPSGGHSSRVGTSIDANCQSTVWALHGYAALGIAASPDAIPFLRGLQQADGGLRTSGVTEGRSDAFCTAEAIVALAGARLPLPAFTPGRLEMPSPHARDSALLAVWGPYDTAQWNVAGATLTGVATLIQMQSSGAYPISILAEGEGARWRASATLHVRTARPLAQLADPPVHALRHVPVTVDATPSVDVDGNVAGVEIHWGDGNVTHVALAPLAHAYERPGAYTVGVRVVDDAGAWSDTLRFALEVANRPPIVSGLPSRLQTARVGPLMLSPTVEDPDGDAVTLAWRLDGQPVPAVVGFAGAALGAHTLALEARDAYGALTTHVVEVDVRNLPPTLGPMGLPAEVFAGESFAFSVAATDADGPPPAVTWRIGPLTREGPEGVAQLPEGVHDVEVVARDADGAERRATTVLIVAPRHGPAQGAPPRVHDVRASLAEGTLRVAVDVSPPEALVTIRWETADASGESEGRVLEIPLDADAARVIVRARLGPMAATSETEVVAPPVAALPSPVFDAVPSRVVAGELAEFVISPVPGAVAYRVALGDGAWTEWGPPVVSHAYARPGSYELRIEARAADGRTSSARATVTVEPRASAPLVQNAMLGDASTAEPGAQPLVATSAADASSGARVSNAVTIPAAEEPLRRELPAWEAPFLLAVAGLLAALGTRAPWRVQPPRRARR